MIYLFFLTELSYSQISRFGISLQQVNYPTSELNNSKNNFSQFQLALQASDQSFKSKWKVDTGLNRYDNVLDIKPIELYYSLGVKKQELSFYIGQKKNSYSLADEKWFLGLWQPVYQRDLLNPEIMGTIGLHLNLSKTYFDFHASYLPLYLPNINPERSTNDSQINSKGRWFRPLSQEIDFIGRKTKINYSIVNPRMEEVVLKSGLLLKTSLKPNDSLIISVSAADKPMNEPQFKYSGKYTVSEQKNDFFNAEISPVIFRHQIYNFEVFNKWNELWSGYLSLGADVPEKKTISQKTDGVGFQAQQQPKDLKYQSVGITYQDNNFCYFCQLDVSYIQIQTDEVLDFDQDGKQIGSVLPNRTHFSRAVSLASSFSYQLFGVLQNLNVSWVRELKLKGQIFKFLNQIQLNKATSISVGFDLLGVDEENIENENSFFNQFRANDRYFVGMNYAF